MAADERHLVGPDPDATRILARILTAKTLWHA